MTSSCIFSSVQVTEKVENLDFLAFNPICLKFGRRGNFEMLITKGKPKLKLENAFSKNCNFLPILTKIIPSTFQQ